MMGAELQLEQALRDAATYRLDAAQARREADRAVAKLKRVELERDALALRVSELLASNHQLNGDLTTIITAAEAGSAYREIAMRARRARSRLPKEGR